MGGGRLQAAFLLVVCAATSLTSAKCVEGIQLCKDMKQDTNEHRWEHMGGISDVKNDYPVENTNEQCVTNITLFDNQLKKLKRCKNYSKSKEPCMMIAKGEDNIVHILMLLLDVQCDNGTQAEKIDGSLMCFHSVSKKTTLSTMVTVPSTESSWTESSRPQTMDTTVTMHTQKPNTASVHQCPNNHCDKSMYGILVLFVVSLAGNVILILILCKRRNGSQRLNCIESESGGYRRCSSDGDFPLDMHGQT